MSNNNSPAPVTAAEYHLMYCIKELTRGIYSITPGCAIWTGYSPPTEDGQPQFWRTAVLRYVHPQQGWAFHSEMFTGATRENALLKLHHYLENIANGMMVMLHSFAPYDKNQMATASSKPWAAHPMQPGSVPWDGNPGAAFPIGQSIQASRMIAGSAGPSRPSQPNATPSGSGASMRQPNSMAPSNANPVEDFELSDDELERLAQKYLDENAHLDNALASHRYEPLPNSSPLPVSSSSHPHTPNTKGKQKVKSEIASSSPTGTVDDDAGMDVDESAQLPEQGTPQTSRIPTARKGPGTPAFHDRLRKGR